MLMPKGIIIKGIGGFYYVKTDDAVIECKARGKFRKKKIIPTVGDKVEVLISNHDSTKGSIENIYPRNTLLVRPPVANVNQIIIVVSICRPSPDLKLLDKLLIISEANNLDIKICLNKVDIAQDKEFLKIYDIYSSAGYDVLLCSSITNRGIIELKSMLKDKITVFAGPSGVGKSSLLNAVQPGFKLKTGQVSKKIERGKHTTRHVELMEFDNGGYVVDTPGFSSIDFSFIKGINVKNISNLFREFDNYVGTCKFRGCTHVSEPGCGVIEAVKNGEISVLRYENYLEFYNYYKNIKEWEK